MERDERHRPQAKKDMENEGDQGSESARACRLRGLASAFSVKARFPAKDLAPRQSPAGPQCQLLSPHVFSTYSILEYLTPPVSLPPLMDAAPRYLASPRSPKPSTLAWATGTVKGVPATALNSSRTYTATALYTRFSPANTYTIHVISVLLVATQTDDSDTAKAVLSRRRTMPPSPVKLTRAGVPPNVFRRQPSPYVFEKCWSSK